MFKAETTDAEGNPMDEILQTARERMKGYCRVCPVCDGRACAGEVPGMGGIGTGSAFTENLRALSARRLKMRLIHDVAEPEISVTLFGQKLGMPILAAPIGGVSFNMGGRISEADYIGAVLAGCRSLGALGGTGDGAPDFIHETAFAAIRDLDGAGIPFIKPWADTELFEKLDAAVATGAPAVGMDVDAAGLVTLRLMGRPVSPKGPDALRKIIERVPRPMIIKGIMTPADARLAADAGAAGIVVSNHGGRVLDGTPGVAAVLPEVAKAVRGRLAVLADGGVRSGGDVLKMLALGADAVLIGRPISVAAVGGLKEGVVRYLEKIRSELITAMILTGSPNLAAIDGSVLQRAGEATP